MLLDTRDETSSEGFCPNVQNKIINSNSSKKGRIGYWVLFAFAWLTIIGGIIMTVMNVQTKNRISSAQMQINESASNIDVQLLKRSELLTQLQDQAIACLRHEGIVLQNVIEARSGISQNQSPMQKNEIITQMQKQIDITFERYPVLQANQAIASLMSQSTVLAYEISAAQRVYNSRATQFNSEIVTWPTNAIIYKKTNPIHSFPLFVASEEQKKVPSFDKMSSIDYNN